MKEACAFYDAVRKDARRCDPGTVVDVCGGHGALGMLFVAHGIAQRAVIIDQSKPPSHDLLRAAWSEYLGPSAVAYDERPLRQAGKGDSAKHVLVVACHACQHLAREIVDCCLVRRTAFAVCPCCPKDPDGSIQAAAAAMGVDFRAAMILAEMGRVAPQCRVALRTFDSQISPHNRIIFGRFDDCDPPVQTAVAETPKDADRRIPSGYAGAEDRLRRAYERAHDHARGAASSGSAGLWSTEEALASVRRGDDELHRKTDAVHELLAPLRGAGNLAAALETLEIRESPREHFRARTIVSVGASPSEGSDGAGLFRYVPDGDRSMTLEANISKETLLPQISAALPAIAELLGSSELGEMLRGLRCVKFHGTLGGSPPQLLVCFVYGPEAAPLEGCPLDELRASLAEALSAVGQTAEVATMASAKGASRCCPEGRDFVDEVLEIPGRGALRYRQPFGQFSNPNPHIAIATAEWLADIVRTELGGTTDLLELYCGAGSHTLVLAPLFRHVLAVEINRHLVTAAQPLGNDAPFQRSSYVFVLGFVDYSIKPSGITWQPMA
ncbi:trmA [Symbiodinium natans]|uniref:TrmA protein n=1 Tax=Symbiodinium natans TaxID=878477 RepID=A0A812G3F8_9DINO|nr:trmA [Symbiodinium natans]